jgi:hypothetical protein
MGIVQNRYVAPLPMHAYGELVKTERGCRYLNESGLLSSLLAKCKWKGPWDNSQSLHRRAVLWALGHIGSTDKGVQMVRLITKMYHTRLPPEPTAACPPSRPARCSSRAPTCWRGWWS